MQHLFQIKWVYVGNDYIYMLQVLFPKIFIGSFIMIKH